jgi:hypothetical protein
MRAGNKKDRDKGERAGGAERPPRREAEE